MFKVGDPVWHEGQAWFVAAVARDGQVLIMGEDFGMWVRGIELTYRLAA